MTNTPFKFLQKAKFKCSLLRRLGKSGQDLEKSAGAEGRAGSRCWLHPPLSLHPDLLPRLLENVCTDTQMPSSLIQVPSTFSSPGTYKQLPLTTLTGRYIYSDGGLCLSQNGACHPRGCLVPEALARREVWSLRGHILLAARLLSSWAGSWSKEDQSHLP